MRTLRLAGLFLGVVLSGCGGDGDGDGGGGVIDAAGAPDAAGVGLGHFCNTLPDGGPECAPDLTCCPDNSTCTLPDDCSGSPGFIPCDTGADCTSSKICCQTDSMTFCTKPSTCNAYGGTEIP
jgi:hypothetical protein